MVKAGVNHRQNQQRQHGGKGEAEHDHHRHTLEKTSRSSGARPSTVVKAVSRIGRRREVAASIIACL